MWCNRNTNGWKTHFLFGDFVTFSVKFNEEEEEKKKGQEEPARWQVTLKDDSFSTSMGRLPHTFPTSGWAWQSQYMSCIWSLTLISLATSFFFLIYAFHFRMNILYNITFHLMVCENLCPWGFFFSTLELCNNHTAKKAAPNIHHPLLSYDPV